MKSIFADTSLFVAFLNQRDEFHENAVEFLSNISVPLVTTIWVLVELGNFLAKGRGRRRFMPFVMDLREEPRVEIVPPDHSTFDRGLALYARRVDKNWSITDCISFEVMRDRGIQEAMTADHHFVQAGFRILLK
jgi:predicted nucleic acid-binding protein